MYKGGRMINKITIKQVVTFIIIVVLVGAVSIFLLLRNNDNNALVFSNPYFLPETPHGGNILHAWNMSFNEIIEHIPYIAQAGFGIIQTSPIGESFIRDTGGRWYDLYQPTRFAIGNYLGTEEEFREMIKVATSYGIFVIVDAIPNHATAYWEEIDPMLREHEPSLFHSRPPENMLTNIWAAPMDFDDRRSFVRSNLLGLRDFYTSRPEFQALYMEFLGKIIDAGASGFRFDAAHHIELPNDPPDIASDFWPVISSFVNERVLSLGRIPFQYGETLGPGHRANHYLHSLYDISNFLVMSYAFNRHIMSSVEIGFLLDGQNGWNSTNFHIHGNPLSQGDTFFGFAFTAPDLGGHEGFAKGIVPFVESHDLYANEGESRHLTNRQILLGWALIAARKDTTPLFFVRPDIGFQNSGNIFIPQDDGSYTNRWGHELFYRDPAVTAINWFANDFIDLDERTATYGSLAIIERGDIGAVLVNVGNEPVDIVFPVGLKDGNYTCVTTLGVYNVLDGWLTGPTIEGQTVVVLRGDFITNVNESDSVLAVYPANINWFSEPLDLTLIAKHINEVTINDEIFKHGEQFTIGEGAVLGDIIKVLLEGGGKTLELSFTMKEPPIPNRIRVEYIRYNNPWETAGIWAWNHQGDVFTGGWPGPAMEWLPRLDGEGYAWVFYFPEDMAVPVSVIFNNSGQGEQTEPYFVITESMRVFQIGDGVLIDIENAEKIN